MGSVVFGSFFFASSLGFVCFAAGLPHRGCGLAMFISSYHFPYGEQREEVVHVSLFSEEYVFSYSLQTQDKMAKITEEFVSWLVHTDALLCKRDVCSINMQAGTSSCVLR